MTFTERLTWLLTPLVVAALMLTAASLYRALDRLTLQHTRAAVDIRLTDIRATLEGNLALGLPLAKITAAQTLIERERAGAPDILAIDVFDAGGTVVFSTDRGLVGEPVPEPWQDARRRQDGAVWLDDAPEWVVVGTPLFNDLDQEVGGVAIVVATARRAAQSTRMIGTLGRTLVWLVPVVLVVWVVGLRLIGRAAGRPFAAAAAVIDPDRAAPEWATADAGDPGNLDPLVGAAVAARAAADRACARLGAAVCEIAALDDDGAPPPALGPEKKTDRTGIDLTNGAGPPDRAPDPAPDHPARETGDA